MRFRKLTNLFCQSNNVRRSNNMLLTHRAFFIFLIFGLTIFGPRTPNVFGADDCAAYTAAIAVLQQIDCAQNVHQDDPGPMGTLQLYPYCPGSVCWNSSSIVGSTSSLEQALAQYYPTLRLRIDTQGGDVRFRCRYSENFLDCFAFRCEASDPAACRRRWWVRHRYSYDGRFFGLDFKLFDFVGFGGSCLPVISQPVCQ
jgi:hypothetical protein